MGLEERDGSGKENRGGMGGTQVWVTSEPVKKARVQKLIPRSPGPILHLSDAYFVGSLLQTLRWTLSAQMTQKWGLGGRGASVRGDIAPVSGAVIPEPPALPTHGLEMGEFYPCSHPHLGWELGRLGVRAERHRAEAGTGSWPGPPGPPGHPSHTGGPSRGLGPSPGGASPSLWKEHSFIE